MVTFLVDLWIIKSIITTLFHVPVTRNWALSFIHVRKSHIWFPLSNISKSIEHNVGDHNRNAKFNFELYLIFAFWSYAPWFAKKYCFVLAGAGTSMSYSSGFLLLFFYLFFCSLFAFTENCITWGRATETRLWWGFWYRFTTTWGRTTRLAKRWHETI